MSHLDVPALVIPAHERAHAQEIRRTAERAGPLGRPGGMDGHGPPGSWNRVVLSRPSEQVERERRGVADLRRRSAGQPAGAPAAAPAPGTPA